MLLGFQYKINVHERIVINILSFVLRYCRTDFTYCSTILKTFIIPKQTTGYFVPNGCISM